MVSAVANVESQVGTHLPWVEDGTPALSRSNEILKRLTSGLEAKGFRVERGKSHAEKAMMPVFFGEQGKASKEFHIDAYHPEHRVGVEVEYGRTIPNNAIYKALIELCLMVDVDYGAVLVPVLYREREHPYEAAARAYEAIFASPRLALPLEGMLLLGY